MSTHHALLAAALVAFLSAGAAEAQTPPPEDRTAPAEPTTRADRVDDDGFDLGWIGLIGLLGLAGLTGRRRGEYTTGGTTRTDRI